MPAIKKYVGRSVPYSAVQEYKMLHSPPHLLRYMYETYLTLLSIDIVISE